MEIFSARSDGWHSLLDGHIISTEPPEDYGDLPTVENTGPTTGSVTATNSGNLTIDVDGTSLVGTHVLGSLTVNASNVAVTDCIVDGSINLNTDNSVSEPATSQVFTRVKASSAWNSYGLSHVTFDACQFTAEGSGNDNSTEMQMRSYTEQKPSFTAQNLTVKNSYFGPPPHNTTGSHLQAIHFMGVQFATIQNCNMEYVAPDADTKAWVTATLYCENYDSACSDITLTGSRLRGGGYYEVNLWGTNYIITDNDFDPDWAGSVIYPSSTRTVSSQSGNTCGDQSVTF